MNKAGIFFAIMVVFAVLPALSFAGSCPPGVKDCFLCGGNNGIPCSSSDSCAGHYDPNSGESIACACPQGKPCVCYCPITETAPPAEPAAPSGGETAQDLCRNVNCPETVCDGGALSTGGYCNPDTGNCEFSGQTNCDNGCAANGLECLEGLEPNADLCANADCPDHLCRDGVYYYNGNCNPTDGKCYHSTLACENGCDPQTDQCAQNQSKATLLVELDKQSVLADGKDSVRITAHVTFSDGTPISGAKVRFELNDPKNTQMFGQWGRASVEKLTDASGEAYVVFTPPDIMSFKTFEQEEFPYSLDVRVTASKHASDADFVIVDESKKILLSSPLLNVESITISPSPAKSGKNHTITATISDPVESPSGYQYVFEVSSGNLIYGNQRGTRVTVDSDSKTASVLWEAPVRGMNVDEFNAAKDLYDTGRDINIALAASGTKALLEVSGEKIAGASLTATGKAALKDTIGYLIPVVEKGKIVYGMYKDTKSAYEEVGNIGRSGSGWETTWRVMDVTASGAKVIVGGIALYAGSTPVIGKFADWTQDIIVGGISELQVGMRYKANQNMIAQSEVKTTDKIVEVYVTDKDGPYEDDDFLKYPMEYVGFKGA